jgi:hypothetical protein
MYSNNFLKIKPGNFLDSYKKLEKNIKCPIMKNTPDAKAPRVKVINTFAYIVRVPTDELVF